MSYIIQERGWRLDRRVPLGMVLAIALQLGAALVWAAQLDTRVARIEKDIDYMRTKMELL
ncbi:MAG: hypothetical protein SFX19_03940 [Alphaproteobacteria bacterium]|nr:hypothetical protein [Alphaproteobacteria bacterium]